MANSILMPKLSEGMTHGSIVKWLKNEGDRVKKGETIAEVETDKSVLELESTQTGYLLKLLIQADDPTQVGCPIAVVGEEGEDIQPFLASLVRNEPSEAASAFSKNVPRSNQTAESSVQRDQRSRVFISPAARRVAMENDIDLNRINGTGPNGRIIARDIHSFLGFIKPNATTVEEPGGGFEDIPVTAFRASVRRRMELSQSTVPHFYIEIEINAQPLLGAVDQLKRMSPQPKITISDALIFACARTLVKHRSLNSRLLKNGIRQYRSVHIGFAVAGEKGVIVPVIENCEQKTVEEIAGARSRLVATSLRNELKPEELTGGTFTISNLGMFGVTRFNAIVNPPQAAILAIGAIQDVAVVLDGKIAPGKRMSLTLSADHRMIDGADGALFLKDLKERLEDETFGKD